MRHCCEHSQLQERLQQLIEYDELGMSVIFAALERHLLPLTLSVPEV